MSIQNKTGDLTEAWVQEKITALGLIISKPIPDRGVDFIVSSAETPEKELKIQVKGRGKIQKNKRYRWFQIRTTKKQRDETLREGMPLNESWRKKLKLVDIFIFVSEMHHEFWVFQRDEIEDLVIANREKYGNRKDNRNGHQAEIDLDVEIDGIALSEKYRDNLDNWELITNACT
ncbi:MAG TPA: hypothetical protein PKL38_11615 [Smithella sp.]|nr:hypothetical protein [Smithella sp.]